MWILYVLYEELLHLLKVVILHLIHILRGEALPDVLGTGGGDVGEGGAEHSCQLIRI